MVVSGEVKQAMEDKDTDFLFRGMAEFARIGGSNVDGDGQVSGEGFDDFVRSRKREDVCGLVLSAESPVELAHLTIGGKKQAHIALDADRFLRGREKTY